MAVKIPLVMGDGAKVKSLDELKEHFDLYSVLKYYDEGRLNRWLRDWYYDDEADRISELDPDKEDFRESLCQILGVKADEGESVTFSEVAADNERRRMLRNFTSDDEILGSIDSVAFNWNELQKLVDSGAKMIYLCGDSFDIRADQPGIKYIGVNNPCITFLNLPACENIVVSDVRPDIDDILAKGLDGYLEMFDRNPELGRVLLEMAAADGNAKAEEILNEFAVRFSEENVTEEGDEAMKKGIIIGIGGAGGNIVSILSNDSRFADTDMLYIDSDKDALGSCTNVKTLQIGPDTLVGLGSGGNVDMGRKSAKEGKADILKLVSEYDAVFLVLGGAGGIGGGAGVEIAKAIREAGISVHTVVTLPFTFEGNTKAEKAKIAYEELNSLDIGTATISLQKVLESAPKKATMKDAYMKIAEDAGSIIEKDMKGE